MADATDTPDIVALFRQAAQAADRRGRDLSAGIDHGTRLDALGLDSITLMEALGKVEQTLGVHLSDSQIAELVTVGDIVAAFSHHLTAGRI